VTGHQPREALITEVLTQPLSARGLDLEGVELSKAGRKTLLRVMVDTDGGVTLDDIAEATRFVGAELDEHDVMGDSPYTLEVTSPGIDRPLTLPRHWKRNIHRLVKITSHDGGSFTGRIESAGDDGATVDVSGQHRQVRYSSVTSARIEIEFNPPKHRQHADLQQED
jgi:ribosome maturation factor RimP